MNETDYIVQKLVEMGWEDNGNGLGGDIFSSDLKFKTDISYFPDADLYEVRLALTGIFDRWANSGSTRIFDSKEKVVKFFESKKYMTAAYEEALMLLEDNFPSDSTAVELMDKIINMTIEWFNE